MAKDKKQSDVLNLNNEVVNMRKEVKRVRALVIRKLTRQIVNLKKKKGKEADLERNQRRAARLLEEVHAMKKLTPDLVTKTALQKNLNFEKVCKNPKSTISDRATARIASHPQFDKKIQAIKAAVKAFKEERMKGGKLVEKENVQKPVEKPQQPQQMEKKEEAVSVIPQKATDDKVRVKVIEDTDGATVGETEEKACSEAPATVQTHTTPESKSEEPAETCGAKDKEKPKIQSQDAEKPPSLEPDPAELQGSAVSTDDEESDLESSEGEEEKEYFDDSTEERFHKQSSQSEDSEDDDFFLGKVSKFKKKKKTKEEGEEKKVEVKKGSEPPSDKLQSELDELESRLKSKGKPCQSVFCSSLAGAKAGRGGGTGRGRGRGGDRGRGSKGGSGPSRDFHQQSKFQKGSESSSVSKYSKPCPEARQPESGEKGFASAGRGRGRGRGRGDAFRQKDPRVSSHQAPQQALHPSWEASKKRKEQQGQILAFQGKKIKFDDDD
uniref:Serum response factor-binding protein 1 n=1 Tax=Salarias fasciatus TaxID=181472 RepID=A0A672IFT1_SALFA